MKKVLSSILDHLVKEDFGKILIPLDKSWPSVHLSALGDQKTLLVGKLWIAELEMSLFHTMVLTWVNKDNFYQPATPSETETVQPMFSSTGTLKGLTTK